jgi:DNA gyrase/topoisomerase IV subunit B
VLPANRWQLKTPVKPLQESGTISVWNNGPGIPVRRVGDADGTSYSTANDKGTEPWVPQMIFGELLTGSNYDDNEQKVQNVRAHSRLDIKCVSHV